MTYAPVLAAVSFEDTKAAAIYFDRVLPIEFRKLRGSDGGVVCEIPDVVPIEIFETLVFGEGAPRYSWAWYFDHHWAPLLKRLAPLQERRYRSTDPEAYTELRELYLSNASSPDTGSVRDAFRTFARGLGVSSFSVLLPTMTEEPSYSESYASLALSKLPLIDTSRASWEQVMELRSDPESRSQLRRLRLFLFENYLGKPIAYVQDDLARRVDEYDRARKKHGFDAVLSSVSVLLEARSLQSAAVASLATALFGGPLVGLSAGAVIELGQFAVELAKQRAAMRELADGHELAFVLRAHERLSR